MNGERKLRLVPPPDDAPSVDEASAEERAAGAEERAAGAEERAAGAEERAAGAEERAAAEALRDALERDEEPLAAELRAAFAPAPLGEADLDAILARALGDEAATTAAERRAADRLRAELDGEAPIEAAALLHALKVAASPAPIEAARNEALIEAALARQPLLRRSATRARRLGPVTMAALAGITALAASVALFVGAPAPRGASAALVRARSTDALFDATTPFPRSGEESARVNRIASARAADLRKNRYASWGVR